MRTRYMNEAGEREIERLVAARQTGHAGRGQADAMIGERAGQNLVLGGPTAQFVVAADQLERSLVRLRAGVGEEYFVQMLRCALRQLVGEQDGRFRGGVEERRVERHLRDL